MKIEDRKGQESFFKQIFLPHVPVYDKTKKEIISTSAGKSVDMTAINHGHVAINFKTHMFLYMIRPTKKSFLCRLENLWI